MENNNSAKPAPENEAPKRKVFGTKLKIALGIVGLILIVVYGMGVSYYSSHFFENTTLEGIAVSNQDRQGTVGLFEADIMAREIEIQFADGTVTLDAATFNPQVTHGEEVAQLIADQNQFLWFLGYLQASDYESTDFISIDEDGVANTISTLDQTSGDIAPSDAYVTYQDGEFVIIPEQLGTMMDVDALIALVEQEYLNGEPAIDVEAVGLYQEATIKSDNAQLVAKLGLAQEYCDASITYQPDADHKFVLDQNTLLTWLTKDNEGNWIKDDDVFATKAEAFIRTFTRYYYTLGITRSFTTVTGETISISGGSLGQYVLVNAETDHLLEFIAEHQEIDRTPALFGYGYQGNSGIGNTYVEINLSAQHLYMIEDGEVVFETDQIVSGLASDPERKTPAGCYYVYYKQLDRVLRGTRNEDGTWPYEVPVRYWIAFNRGIGMHDATFRSSFGGNIYTYNGSHGCVNMTYAEAGKMYEYTKIGTPVICYY